MENGKKGLGSKEFNTKLFDEYSRIVTEDLVRLCGATKENGSMAVMALVHSLADFCYLAKINVDEVQPILKEVYEKYYSKEALEKAKVLGITESDTLSNAFAAKQVDKSQAN